MAIILKNQNRKDRHWRELPNDAEERDVLLWGRRTDLSRRGFLRGAGLSTLEAALGATVPFWRWMPAGLVPSVFAEQISAMPIAGKSGLMIHNERPINAETPAHLLANTVTPTRYHFVRSNGVMPTAVDPATWRLKITGAVERELELSIADLRRMFSVVDAALQIECGGNGRAGVYPGASGNPWQVGAIGNARWKGVRLADVLRYAGVKPDAIYTGHRGADRHLSGDPSKAPLSRGVPISKALQPENLIAFGMNGGEIHPLNGAPLRLVVPGWPGSCSQKWLTEIVVSRTRWSGAKMAPPAYAVPIEPAVPGSSVPPEAYAEIHSMPVKSLITTPRNGTRLVSGRRDVEVAGHAWAGDTEVERVDVSIDFGMNWQRATLTTPPNPYSWQSFAKTIRLPTNGYFEIWARATDKLGRMQPFAPVWNPKGYLNNALHRIAVIVEPAKA